MSYPNNQACRPGRGTGRAPQRKIRPARQALGSATAAVLVATAAVIATPSVASASSSVNLQMWIAGNNTTKPIYTAEAEAFSKAHPGVTVTINDLPGPAYTQKLDPALAANKLPAIFQEYSNGPALRELVSAKKVVDLSRYLKSNTALTKRILPSAMAQGQVDGQQYGIPYNIFQESVVLYNKASFKKARLSGPPSTWPALLGDVAKLKKAGTIPISMSGTVTDNWYEWWLEDYEVRKYGLGITDQVVNGKFSVLNSPALVASAAPCKPSCVIRTSSRATRPLRRRTMCHTLSWGPGRPASCSTAPSRPISSMRRSQGSPRVETWAGSRSPRCQEAGGTMWSTSLLNHSS